MSPKGVFENSTFQSAAKLARVSFPKLEIDASDRPWVSFCNIELGGSKTGVIEVGKCKV